MSQAPRKFRVWDGEEMHYPPHEFMRDGKGRPYIVRPLPDRDDKDYSIILSVDGAEDMDYTGLDDADGTPIYEGDFVTIVDSDEPPSLVVWDERCAGFYMRRPNGAFVSFTGKEDEYRRVVGNRFENPELLEEVTA